MNRLAIIVGHEQKAQGASATHPLNCSEYKFNKELAEQIFQMAQNNGLTCGIFYRDGLGVTALGAKVNEWAKGHEAVAIELHLNSAEKLAAGTETLYDADPTTSKEFAQLVQNAMCKLFKREGKQNRGAKLIGENDRGHRNLAAVKITSCLVEPVFANNPSEAKLLWSNKAAYARCLVAAAVEWFQTNKEGKE